jgi:hypothetical protein
MPWTWVFFGYHMSWERPVRHVQEAVGQVIRGKKKNVSKDTTRRRNGPEQAGGGGPTTRRGYLARVAEVPTPECYAAAVPDGRTAGTGQMLPRGGGHSVWGPSRRETRCVMDQ